MIQDHDGLVGERRDLELGAGLSALPHPKLPDDMDARLRAALEVERRRRRRRRSVTTLGLAAALTAIVLGGAALAGAFDSDSSSPWPKPPLPGESVYPTNAAGQTYGVDKPLVTEPDLVSVIATNGKHGYCLGSDLDGPADGITPSTPPEVTEDFNERGLRGYTIPVYESDGVTQIGVFQIGGPGTTASYGSPDGGTVTETADIHGNIITTTTHPDGTVTVESEALDGTVTTKTYQDESEVPPIDLPKPPATTAAGPHVDRPPGWLSARMSELASAAGDARATAWWELQTRYYLKGIEGDNAPESPYQQWTDVWLVILHGDFAGGSWRYWLLDRDSHNVLSQAQSDKPFDTSSHDLQPMPGPIKLGAD
jgi:hypothetical protein